MNFKIAALVVLTSLGLALIPRSASAQEGIEILQQEASYSFNQELRFHAEYQSSAKMINGYVFFQLSGSDHTWVYEGELSSGSNLDVTVPIDAANAPRVFTTIDYWFRFASDHGKFFESPHYSLYYEDNRYAWQSLQTGPFTVRWHAGDQAFAEAILAAAQQGVERANGLIQLPEPSPLTMQVYDNPADVQLVARLSGYPWVAGHSDPASGLILLAIAPDDQQSLEIQRQVPHEVAHVLLYQALGAQQLANLPVWLNEGFASNVEVYSDPLRSELLDVANETNTLIPFASLCNTFPQDETSARLAYAESASFVRYLFDHYNKTGFEILIDAYAAGGDCITASEPSFGKALPDLDAEWRQATFASPSDLVGQVEALPWSSIAAGAAVALGLWALVRRLSRSGSHGR